MIKLICCFSCKYDQAFNEGWSGSVDRASDFGPRGPWFDSPPVHISLWP